MVLKPVSALDIKEGLDEIALRVGIDPKEHSGAHVSILFEPLAAKIGLSVPNMLLIRQGDLLRWLRIIDGEALPEDRPSVDVLLLIVNPSLGLARICDILQRCDYPAMIEEFGLSRKDIDEWRGDVGRYVWDVMLGMGVET